MLKGKKIVSSALVIASLVVPTSSIGQAAGFNYSYNYNWQITTVSSQGKTYEKIYNNIYFVPSRPSRPNTNIKPVEPSVPQSPVIQETPVVPEVPNIPEVPTTSSSLSSEEAEVVRLVNIERSKLGLPAFKISNELSNVARLKSQDMAMKNYFSHTSPTYGSPFEMMKQFGISYKMAGENIAKGYFSAQSVVNGWMNSSGHRENILNPGFQTIGVGAYTLNNTIYWTQMFTN